MKNSVEIISKYQSGADDVDKLWLLRQLEDYHLDQVGDFFLAVLLDPEEDDNARVEVLGILKLLDVDSGIWSEKIADALLRVLEAEDDNNVLNYTAMALSNFIVGPKVLSCLEEIVESDRYDEDLRYNALDAIEINADNKLCLEALRRLVRSSNLGPEIQERLDQGEN